MAILGFREKKNDVEVRDTSQQYLWFTANLPTNVGDPCLPI